MKVLCHAASALLLTGALALAADKKIAPDMPIQPGAAVDVIVQYSTRPTISHHEGVIRRGGTLKKDLGGILKAAAYRIPASALADLATDPDIAYITPDRPVKGMLNYTAAAVNASVAWSQYSLDGTAIGVAVIDSGISNVEDLKTSGKLRVLYSQDFVGGGTDDHYGHGGHVAVIGQFIRDVVDDLPHGQRRARSELV